MPCGLLCGAELEQDGGESERASSSPHPRYAPHMRGRSGVDLGFSAPDIGQLLSSASLATTPEARQLDTRMTPPRAAPSAARRLSPGWPCDRSRLASEPSMGSCVAGVVADGCGLHLRQVASRKCGTCQHPARPNGPRAFHKQRPAHKPIRSPQPIGSAQWVGTLQPIRSLPPTGSPHTPPHKGSPPPGPGGAATHGIAAALGCVWGVAELSIGCQLRDRP